MPAAQQNQSSAEVARLQGEVRKLRIQLQHKDEVLRTFEKSGGFAASKRYAADTKRLAEQLLERDRKVEELRHELEQTNRTNRDLLQKVKVLRDELRSQRIGSLGTASGEGGHLVEAPVAPVLSGPSRAATTSTAGGASPTAVRVLPTTGGSQAGSFVPAAMPYVVGSGGAFLGSHVARAPVFAGGSSATRAAARRAAAPALHLLGSGCGPSQHSTTLPRTTGESEYGLLQRQTAQWTRAPVESKPSSLKADRPHGSQTRDARNSARALLRRCFASVCSCGAKRQEVCNRQNAQHAELARKLGSQVPLQTPPLQYAPQFHMQPVGFAMTHPAEQQVGGVFLQPGAMAYPTAAGFLARPA